MDKIRNCDPSNESPVQFSISAFPSCVVASFLCISQNEISNLINIRLKSGAFLFDLETRGFPSKIDLFPSLFICFRSLD